MHNFSYLGGLIGLGIGIVFQISRKAKEHSMPRAPEAKQ
jgi:hypothetical protein